MLANAAPCQGINRAASVVTFMSAGGISGMKPASTSSSALPVSPVVVPLHRSLRTAAYLAVAGSSLDLALVPWSGDDAKCP